MAESTTENLLREFYGASTFVEKRDIPKKFGFQSKRAGSVVDGYPDFFKDMGEWLIVVEAKSGDPGPKTSHAAAPTSPSPWPSSDWSACRPSSTELPRAGACR